MRDWELTTDGDLKIGNNLDYIVAGIDELVQRLKFRLRIFLGEWYRDITLGIDYFGKIFKKNPLYADIDNEFRKTILQTDGVKELVNLTIKFSTNLERKLDVNFKVLTDDNVLIEVLL